MVLIYLDESGINYRIRDGLYSDGPFLVIGAIFENSAKEVIF